MARYGLFNTHTMSETTTVMYKNPLERPFRPLSFTDIAISEVDKKPSYMIILSRDEDGRVVVRCPNLQGVATDGADEKEAIRNAHEAIEGILETRNMKKDYNITVVST